MSVTRAHVDAICAVLPGATLSHPPELISWKVGGKMFACFGKDDAGDGVSVKCRDVDTARMLIDAGAAQKAAYFHASWVRLPFAQTDRAEAAHRLTISYDLIRASLPKATRTGLAQREGT